MTGNKNSEIKEMETSTASGNINWYNYFRKSQALINYEVTDAHTISSSKSTPWYISTCQEIHVVMHRAAFFLKDTHTLRCGRAELSLTIEYINNK